MSRVILMVGTEKGGFIFRSDESRGKWEMSGPVLKGWAVQDLRIDQRATPVMLAAAGHEVYGPGIQVSKDLGTTWETIENPPKFAEGASGKLNNIWTITPGLDAAPDTFFAGTDDAALFVTHDRCKTWIELPGVARHETRDEWMGGAGGLCLHSIIVHPTNPDRIWVAISAVGVLRTDDSGMTWQVKNKGLEITIEGEEHKEVGSCVHRMVLDPTNPDRLFQQNHMGVFRSADGGDSWETIENGLPGRFGFPMVVHPREPGVLFTAPQESDEYRFARDGRLTIYRTRDAGDSWHETRQGLPDNAYVGVLRQAMAIDDLESPGVYFGTNSGQVFCSNDTGDSWTALPCALPRIKSVNVAVVE
jgi:hypothetical protein